MTEGGVSIFDITRLHKSALQSWLKEKTEIEICRVESAHSLLGNCFGWYSFSRSCQFFCHYFVLRFCFRRFLLAILFYDHSEHPCEWDSEDDTENSTERGSCEHDDKNEKGGEVQCFTHHLGDEEVVLDTLYDEIKSYYDSCRLPPEPQTDDRSRDESEEWSYVRYELHNSPDDSESECSICIDTEEVVYP